MSYGRRNILKFNASSHFLLSFLPYAMSFGTTICTYKLKFFSYLIFSNKGKKCICYKYFAVSLFVRIYRHLNNIYKNKGFLHLTF